MQGYSEHVRANYSMIQNSTVVLDRVEVPSIGLSIDYEEPDDGCREQLGFMWEFVEYKRDSGLQLQLMFDNPHCISMSSNTGDTLRIDFNDQRLFLDTEGNYIAPNLSIKRGIPRQLTEDDQKVSELVKDSTGAIIASACVLTLISEAFFKQGLNKLLQAWNCLQYVIHMVLIDLFCSASSESITSHLLQYLKVEFVDIKPQLIDLFKVEATDAIDMHFEASGYETSDFILNLGPASCVIILAPLYIFLLALVSKVCCCTRLTSFTKKRLDGVLFNGIIHFISAEVLLLMTSICINIKQVNKGAAEAKFSFYLAWVTHAFVLTFVTGIIIVLIKNRKRLHQ